MGYRPYMMARDRLARHLATDIPKKAWKENREAYIDHVIKRFMSVPGAGETLDASILVDEEVYCKDGCRMLFPETPALLEMLWRAKMDIDLADLDLAKVPRAFSIAWPMCEIEGVKLPGCLIMVGPNGEREKEIHSFGLKYYGHGIDVVDARKCPVSDDEIGIHISYFGDITPESGTYPFGYRSSIPNHFLKGCLKSAGGMAEFLGSFRGAWRGVLDLTKEEQHQSWVISRLIVHLIVYMQACPETLKWGYPTPKGDRAYRSAFCGEVKGQVLQAPEGLRGEHASPSTHWRTWHFRSYPVKKDGSKKAGVIFIHGTVVNAEVDPITAEVG